MRRNKETSEECADDADPYAERATVLDLLARGQLRTHAIFVSLEI